MLDDRVLLGEAYLQHCTGRDLDLLAATSPDAPRKDLLLAHPESVPELIASDALASAVFAAEASGRPETPFALFPASPFLVFSVAVERTRRELVSASYTEEWLGPRHRAPIFDVSGQRDFLADAWRRLFLAELLASYTKVSSGSVAVPTRHGMRRQRFSELDPVRLASLLEVVAASEHPGIYRRLGDLALFLTGVFPDHTALHGVSSTDEARLLRAGRIDPRRAGESSSIPGFGDASAVRLFELLGRRWYRLAYELVPAPQPRSIGPLGELSRRFSDARRVLNVLTDHYLFPLRQQFFGISQN